MLPAPESSNSSDSYLWQVDGIDLRVVLANGVLAELRALLASGSEPEGVGSGSEPESPGNAGASEACEIGGILLGRSERDESGFCTHVDAFEPFLLENRAGPNFMLSGQDTRKFERRLSFLSRRRPQGRVAVGLWRSHCRRGLYLDQRDFGFFQRFFHHPDSIFLLVRRDEGGGKGAVFVWEEDDVRRHASYLEFPLPAKVATVGAVAAKATAVPIMPSVAKPVPRGRGSKWGLTIQPGLAIQWGRAVWQTVLKYKSAALEYAVGLWKMPAVTPKFLARAALVVLTVALPGMSFYIGRQVARSRHRGITVAHANPAPPAPVRDVRPEPPPPPADPSPAEPMPDEASPVLSSRDRVAAASPVKARRRIEIPPVVIPARSASLPDPPPTRKSPAMASLPAIMTAAPAPPSLSAGGVTAYIKPASGSGIRHAIRKIFAAPRNTEGFVPASPLDHPLPELPEDAAPGSDTSVELLARIDRSGAVAHVKYADGNSQLTGASSTALAQWRFEPARQNGAPVESDMLVRFEFRRKP